MRTTYIEPQYGKKKKENGKIKIIFHQASLYKEKVNLIEY